MLGLLSLVAIVALLAWLQLRRRSRRLERRRARLEALSREAAGADLAVAWGEAGAPTLDVRHADSGARLRLPWERPGLDVDLADCFADPERLVGALAFQFDHSVRPHGDALTLNRQARDLAPLLIRRELLVAFPERELPPHTRLGATGLAAIYRFLGVEGLLYLGRDSFEATGLDVEGLHGALLALLAQRLDESTVAEARRGEGARVLEDAEGVSTSFVFLLPELLDAGEELMALLPNASRLVLVHPDGLDETVDRERRSAPSPGTWLAKRPIRVDSLGWRSAEEPAGASDTEPGSC